MRDKNEANKTLRSLSWHSEVECSEDRHPVKSTGTGYLNSHNHFLRIFLLVLILHTNMLIYKHANIQ